MLLEDWVTGPNRRAFWPWTGRLATTLQADALGIDNYDSIDPKCQAALFIRKPNDFGFLQGR